MSSYIINILIISPICCVFGSKIPLDDILMDLTRETIHTDELSRGSNDKNIPQYILPSNYYPAIDSALQIMASENSSQEISFVEDPKFNEETTELEPRTLPLLINFILLPKLIIKLAKAIAFGVSAVTTIGTITFLFSAILCTFTPFCFVGLALRNVERSGRNFVQQIYENIPGEKIEAAADILSNVLDKYAKIRISQSNKDAARGAIDS